MLVSCPFCGHSWDYKGTNEHYATCTGKIGVRMRCLKKVRLHPYVRRGYKPLTPLKFPNKNYKLAATLQTEDARRALVKKLRALKGEGNLLYCDTDAAFLKKGAC